MSVSRTGSGFQRVAFFLMLALVFSLLAPVASAFGEEADSSAPTGEVVQPDSGTSGESTQEVESEGNSASIPDETDTSESDGAAKTDEDQGVEDAELSEEGSSEAEQPQPATDVVGDTEALSGTDGTEPVDEASTSGEGEESEVVLVIESEVGEGSAEVQVVTLAAPEDPASASTMAATATGLQPVHESPENVVAVLVGDGVTYANVQYTGSPSALGTFTGGEGIVGFPGGVIIGTGNILHVVGPNEDSGMGTGLDEPGNAHLTELAEQQTYDAAVLSFDFVPTGNMIQFQYVFSSEEYNEYVGDYNDVFAFYVNGQSCAMINGEPVSVNSINAGSNSELFIDNTDGHLNTEMDGMTVVLTCQAPVVPGQSNSVVFMIADSGDPILDSHVFMQAKSFSISIPEPEEPGTPDDDSGEKPVLVGPDEKPVSKDPVAQKDSPSGQDGGPPAKVTALPDTGTGATATGEAGVELLVMAAVLILMAMVIRPIAIKSQR